MLLGIFLGMGSNVMKGSDMISYNVGLFEGSKTSNFCMRFLALSEMVMCSGKEY